MTKLSDGARQLPLRHLSIRVPWNDIGWEGRVCERPAENISCLILSRIREKRNDAQETTVAGRPWKELSADQLPVCVSERGQFMDSEESRRWLVHPYSETSKAHQHLKPTLFRYPPYSAACMPFNWMLKESAREHVESLELDFQPELEDDAHREMGFETEWVQVKYNQLVMLDTFFGAIQPKRSLAFFYAKRIPLVDDTRRIVIGVGWVDHVGDYVEYDYRGPGPLESVLWGRSVQHSIRPGFRNGFLLPYHEVIEYIDRHPEEDPVDYVAFVPDDQFWSFSYGSEHVTNDGAIGVLLSCAKALQNIKKIVPGPWEQVLEWVNARLNELWAMRGPYPGLGAALTAFGVENGSLIAYELERMVGKDLAGEEDPWIWVDKPFREPGSFPAEIKAKISANLQKKWEVLPDERRALLKLISRFELKAEQATRYYVHEDKQRSDLHIQVNDAELLANPYLIYEVDRVAPEPVNLSIIDRGVFPDASIREKYPLEKPSLVDDALDGRRVRALVVRQLENAALNGDTLRPRSQVIQEIRELDIQPACPVDGDLMTVVEESFKPAIRNVELADGQPAYQLERLAEVGQTIQSTVTRRVNGVRHSGEINWRERLDAALKGPAEADDELEQAARQEKAAALNELFASRFSVLIGPAVTGKTTLLKVLIKEPRVEAGGVLMLAPTGKARVRMDIQTEIQGSQTIAQFLLPLDRYDPQTGTYRLSDRKKIEAGKTVIIDEASMLTEEQLSAVLDALKGVERLILVGDPRQLPPIGAGRPFLDIVRELAPENVESIFPRIGKGYAELTVRRRQIGLKRDDLLLAEWFSGRPLDAGADEIWELIRNDEPSEYLRFVQWDFSEELQQKLFDVLVEELELSGQDDSKGFEISLGGSLYGDSVYFWPTREDQPGACASVENWQILSPVHNAPHGVEALNRLIQSAFRAKTKESANRQWRKIPKPMGREEILYGDKVIHTQNQRRYDVWPKDDALKYVANGEIGIVVGQFKGKNAKYKGLPWKMEVEFSSQPGYRYGYKGMDFAEEGSPTLELAYTLTVHKTQSSEFGKTFVILPNPCILLSRELIYTALTRQKERVVIFHQGDRHALRRYSEDYYSESARRLTNLFRSAEPVMLEDRFLEEGLIHKTRRGESVRSKSEVIIANLLNEAGVDYSYELSFVGSDGSIRYPDFTIEDDETGQLILWEHLGMMVDPKYRERWNQKLAWYHDQGVLPYDEGGGTRGVLVTTQDDERGGINSEEIERLIQRLFG